MEGLFGCDKSRTEAGWDEVFPLRQWLLVSFINLTSTL